MRVHVTPGHTLYKKQRTAQLSKVQYFVFPTAACFYWYLLVRTSYHSRTDCSVFLQQCKIIIIIIQCVYMCTRARARVCVCVSR